MVRGENEQMFLMRDIGYWDALAWAALFGVVLLLAYLLLRRHRNERETEAFLCGESFEYSTPPNDFFFGFEKVLEPLFKAWGRFQAGVINEYVAWVIIFALLSVFLFILMFIAGAKKI
ncbi:MAG: hypothetical protein V1909_04715 [Candidatus Micrarchaeota archaeon]